MSHVTVKNLIAVLIKYKKELQFDCDCAENGILYIDFRDGKPSGGIDTTTFEAMDGSEVHLDINSDGLVAGIEFY